jgi:hypothetical protein
MLDNMDYPLPAPTPIYERDVGICIGNQNFSNKPSIDQNTICRQLFDTASVGNKPNMPYIFFNYVLGSRHVHKITRGEIKKN